MDVCYSYPKWKPTFLTQLTITSLIYLFHSFVHLFHPFNMDAELVDLGAQDEGTKGKKKQMIPYVS